MSIRILHLRDSSFCGSPEQLILGQIRHFGDSEFTFYVASFAEGFHRSSFPKHAAHVAAGCLNIGTKATALPRLINVLKKYRIDILVTHDYKSNFFAFLSSFLFPCSTVGVFHGRTSFDANIRIYERLDTFILRRFSHLIAVCESGGRLLSKMGIPWQQISVVYNAIDDEAFRGRVSRQLNLRKELAVPSDATLIGCVGRLSPEKGQRILLQSITKLAAENPNYHFVFVGDGPDREVLINLANRSNILSRSFFLGLRTDVASIMANLDLLVLPSYTENLPVVILEAFSIGLPVLATAVGGVPEMIRDNETGFLVKPGDPKALARKIMFSFQQDRTKVAANATRSLKERFSYEKHNDQLKYIYKQLCILDPQSSVQ